MNIVFTNEHNIGVDALTVTIYNKKGNFKIIIITYDGFSGSYYFSTSPNVGVKSNVIKLEYSEYVHQLTYIYRFLYNYDAVNNLNFFSILDIDRIIIAKSNKSSIIIDKVFNQMIEHLCNEFKNL